MKIKDFCLLKQNSSQLFLKNLSRVGDFLLPLKAGVIKYFEMSYDLKIFLCQATEPI